MRTLGKKIYAWINQNRVEVSILFGTLVLGSIYTAYVYTIGLTLVFVDQNSHANIARQIVDSLTPGISQIGFWPPLLHVLMAPFSVITPLFVSGFAGAVVLVPVFAIGALYLYRVIFILTHQNSVSVVGAILFATNPYLLYYAATPMTETLFVSLLIIVAYYLLVWLKTQSFRSLVLLGICVTLTGLARFEGFFLIPVVGGILILKLLILKKHYHEVEANTILFLILGCVGVASALLYGLIYAGNPLVFMNGAWSASAQQQFFFLPSEGSVGKSFLYLLTSSNYVVGKTLVVMGIFSFVFAAVTLCLRFDKRRLQFFAASAVLVSPFVFDIFALYSGSAVLYVASLPPFGEFFNERYGLYGIGFIILSLMTFTSLLVDEMHSKFYSRVRAFIGAVLLFTTLSFSIGFLYTTAHADKFSIITSSAPQSFAKDQIALARVLKHEYDYGKILITRALQNFVTVEAGIPLKNYILESNYNFYDSALESPWFYARFVVMYNSSVAVEDWRKQNEKISLRWGDSPLFTYAYELVYENDSERLYRLRENELRELLVRFDIDESKIPSLNRKLTRWNSFDLSKYLASKTGGTIDLIGTHSEQIVASARELK